MIGKRLAWRLFGAGMALLVASPLLRHGFQSVEMDRIVGVANPKNKASCRVLQKIGLIYQGLRYDYENDLAFFELTLDEYSRDHSGR